MVLCKDAKDGEIPFGVCKQTHTEALQTIVTRCSSTIMELKGTWQPPFLKAPFAVLSSLLKTTWGQDLLGCPNHLLIKTIIANSPQRFTYNLPHPPCRHTDKLLPQTLPRTETLFISSSRFC